MTESVSVKVVRLETQMQDSKVQLSRVESKVDSLIVKVDSINTLQQEISALKQDFNTLKEQVASNTKREAITKWLYPTLSAIIGIVSAYLIEFYLAHK